MKRSFALLACAMALALTLPVSHEAQAGKSVACKATSLDGKSTKWKCKSGEKCCYSLLLNQGTCSKEPICL